MHTGQKSSPLGVTGGLVSQWSEVASGCLGFGDGGESELVDAALWQVWAILQPLNQHPARGEQTRVAVQPADDQLDVRHGLFHFLAAKRPGGDDVPTVGMNDVERLVAAVGAAAASVLRLGSLLRGHVGASSLVVTEGMVCTSQPYLLPRGERGVKAERAGAEKTDGYRSRRATRVVAEVVSGFRSGAAGERSDALVAGRGGAPVSCVSGWKGPQGSRSDRNEVKPWNTRPAERGTPQRKAAPRSVQAIKHDALKAKPGHNASDSMPYLLLNTGAP